MQQDRFLSHKLSLALDWLQIGLNKDKARVRTILPGLNDLNMMIKLDAYYLKSSYKPEEQSFLKQSYSLLLVLISIISLIKIDFVTKLALIWGVDKLILPWAFVVIEHATTLINLGIMDGA